MMSLLKPTLLVLLSLVARLAVAGTFELSASVDRRDVELGEPLRYTLSVQVTGRLDFPVQLESPKFDGFQASGPQQMNSSSWMNGAVTEQHTWTWELVPIKAGTLTLGPIRANAKSALDGEIKKETPAISIKVRRPKNAYNPNPSASSGQVLVPTPFVSLPSDETLRDIKPDLGLPWGQLAAVFGGFAAVLAFLAWLALPRRPKEAVETVPADPARHALDKLEQLHQHWRQGEEAAYAKDVHGVLRDYYKHRLGLRHEATLAEALRAARQRGKDLKEDYGWALRERLELLLFGDAPFADSDKDALADGAKAAILDMEKASAVTAISGQKAAGASPLSAAMDLAVATWRGGQPRGAWTSMRAAFLRHLRMAHGLSDRAQMEAFVQKTVAGMGDERLTKAAGLLMAKEPPKDTDPRDLADDFLALAKALAPKLKQE